jgi:hypothetical protein
MGLFEFLPDVPVNRAIAQPIMRFESSSNSIFVTFVTFVVAPIESGGQRPE